MSIGVYVLAFTIQLMILENALLVVTTREYDPSITVQTILLKLTFLNLSIVKLNPANAFLGISIFLELTTCAKIIILENIKFNLWIGKIWLFVSVWLNFW